MNTRQLSTVVVGLFGIYMIVQGCVLWSQHILMTIVALSRRGGLGPDALFGWPHMIATLLGILTSVVPGVLLILYRSRISNLFALDSQEGVDTPIPLEGLGRLAVGLMGLSFIAKSLYTLVVMIDRGIVAYPLAGSSLTKFIVSSTYGVVGIILFFGSRKISSFLTSP